MMILLDPMIYGVVIGAYLMGSIPFGFLLTKWSGMGDIRAIGSGNIGTTNVLRTGNKKIALCTFFLDTFKGAFPVYLTLLMVPEYGIFAGFFAIFGHIFPIWLKFRGGKGVATAFGATVALSWPLGLMMLVTWSAIAVTTRYSSLSALSTVLLSPFYAFVLTSSQVMYYCLGVAVLLVVTHKNNIQRLILGQEPKIGDDTSEPENEDSDDD